MPSLNNAAKRKTHKERAQPAHRKKYGLLEKAKDYKKRAKDFHKKEDAIKILRQKAEERNPDEFYFAMEKARTKDGVHQATTNEANKYSQDELRLMKTQDVKYITHKERVESEKIRKMKSSLHFIGAAKPQQHKVFVDTAEEAATFKPEDYFDTPAELLDRNFNRPRSSTLTGTSAVLAGGRSKTTKIEAKKAEKKKLSAYKELGQRVERFNKVQNMSLAMSMKKELMGKGTKRKLSKKEKKDGGNDGEAPVYKWKRERKK
eukprot:gene10014-7900_t